MSEIQLLSEALSTQGEAEAEGVKYIYMDDNTVYRFENNRMKKVSAAMLKKAAKFLQSQGALPNDIAEKAPKPKKGAKKAAKVKPQPVEEEEEAEEPDDEPAPPPPPKPARKNKAKAVAPAPISPPVDLDEYYNAKHKMEYMSLEIDRLTNKVNRLKQYKSIVNKITGGEYDPPEPAPQPQAQPQQVQQQPRSRSLFDDWA